MDIGRAIRDIRKLKGVSQKQLAELTGISAVAISQIEKGKTMPRKESLKTICESLSVPISYIAFFSLDFSDLPEDKRVLIQDLEGMIRSVVENEIKAD